MNNDYNCVFSVTFAKIDFQVAIFLLRRVAFMASARETKHKTVNNFLSQEIPNNHLNLFGYSCTPLM